MQQNITLTDKLSNDLFLHAVKLPRRRVSLLSEFDNHEPDRSARAVSYAPAKILQRTAITRHFLLVSDSNKRVCENKHAKTHAVMRKNVGLLREIVSRLTPLAEYTTHNTNCPCIDMIMLNR